jgi:hypothetical protein
MTLFNPGMPMAFQNSPIDGTIDARRQALSGVDVPHSFVASGLARLPFAINGSFLLRAQSGRPYAYVAANDANGDGVRPNDLFYVPRDSTDISLANPTLWPALDRFIEGEACLREQRGRIMARNSCRNPTVFTLDTRLAKTVALGSKQMELALDVFDLPNLLSRRWGLVRMTADREPRPLVSVAGWDAAANRPVYVIPTLASDASVAVPPSRKTVVPDASRWKMQLGARYRFR